MFTNNVQVMVSGAKWIVKLLLQAVCLMCLLYIGLDFLSPDLALENSFFSASTTNNNVLNTYVNKSVHDTPGYDASSRKSEDVKVLHVDLGENAEANVTQLRTDVFTCESAMKVHRPYHFVCDTKWRKEVNCEDLISGKVKSQLMVQSYLKTVAIHVPSDEDMIRETQNCDKFRCRYGYRGTPASDEEAEYPIAYSFMIYRDMAQFEMAFRATYHPQNVYCLHVDTTAESPFKSAVKNLASCFDNVFLATNPVNVIYGGFSRLEADFSCMRDLLRSKVPWKYLINLTGHEFPLKTNFEIMKILKSFRYHTDLDVNMKSLAKSRRRFRHHWEAVENRGVTFWVERPEIWKDPPGDGVRLVKGGAYGLFTRDFLSYVLSMPPVVKRFLDWSSDVWSPDEIFWATVYMRKYNPMFQTPGAFDSEEGKNAHKRFLAKFVVWSADESNHCFGRFVRHVCIFGTQALPMLVAQPEVFANKFDINKDHVVLNCLGEWIHNRTYYQPDFKKDFYENYAQQYFS